jgi:hypothetical protein
MTDDVLQEMIDPQTTGADVPRRRRLTATVLILALAVLGITSLTTGAIFTDRETTNGDLLTGTVDLSTDELTLTMPTGGMAPGDVIVAPVTVTNSGSLQLRYGVAYQATDTGPGTDVSGDTADDLADAEAVAGTGDLREQLTLDVFEVAAATSCTAAATLPSTDSGTATDLSTAGPLGGFTPILGDATTTPITDGRSLAAATGSEILCVRLSFDIDADNSYQNTTADVTLRFDAEQVVNNP